MHQSVGAGAGLGSGHAGTASGDQGSISLRGDRLPDKPHAAVGKHMHRPARMEGVGFVVVVTIDYTVAGGGGIGFADSAVEAIFVFMIPPTAIIEIIGDGSSTDVAARSASVFAEQDRIAGTIGDSGDRVGS